MEEHSCGRKWMCSATFFSSLQPCGCAGQSGLFFRVWVPLWGAGFSVEVLTKDSHGQGCPGSGLRGVEGEDRVAEAEVGRPFCEPRGQR